MVRTDRRSHHSSESHRFLVSNTATDAVKFIHDRVCAAIVRMNCNVVYALVYVNLPAGVGLYCSPSI